MYDSVDLIKQTKVYIHNQFSSDTTGHDFYHIQRVVDLAKQIAQEEKADLFLVELAAWLHDVGDYKLHEGKDRSAELIQKYLSESNLDENLTNKIVQIVSEVSFSKGKTPSSQEARIVQDADRLDAIGAIGIARAFTYGGSQQRQIWDPENSSETTIQHFHDKLLKLRERMSTQTAKKIAQQRHQFLEEFLENFHKEWGEHF